MPDGRRFRGLTGNRVVVALQRAGWEIERQRGSHVRMSHPERPEAMVTVPMRRGKAVKPATIFSVLRQAGLTADEFEELL